VDRALAGSNADASYYHGKDGFGEVPDPEAPDLSHISKEHAVLALIRLVDQYPGTAYCCSRKKKRAAKGRIAGLSPLVAADKSIRS